MSPIDRPRVTFPPDRQMFDEFRVITVPRWKESGLSGDEYRISATAQWLYKGTVIYERSFRDVPTAVELAHATKIVDWEHADQPKFSYTDLWEKFCNQEGCKELAVVTYKLKQEYCKDGHPHEIRFGTKYRRFCIKHKSRGDCSLEDSDDNYELIEDLGVA